jgi:DNA-binding NarL/FixJ family response regulator
VSTKIVLADDHHLVRQALRVLLETEPGFAVVGETADGRQAADLVAERQPDVVIADLRMPGLGGTEVARQVSKRSPATRVIILSMHMTEAHVLEALRSGVHGYVRKDATASDLVRAVHDVAAGHLYLSPPFSDKAIEAYRQRAAEAEVDAYDTLSDREREVLHLAAEGLSNPEVGDRLAISPRTVETHRTNLMRKLGLRRQVDLIRYAIRRGILPLEQDGTSKG